MLKLLIFAPCERMIEDKGGTVSLISVLDSVELNIDGDIPPDALVPFRWTILTMWRRERDVEGEVEFEQRTDVVRPDGTSVAGGMNTFKVTNAHLNYRLKIDLQVFPLGMIGDVLVKARIRQTNPETEWRDVGEYPILVAHNRKAKDEGAGNENAEVG